MNFQQKRLDYMRRSYDEVVNEKILNLERKNQNEQKDRIITNIKASGFSEFSNRNIAVREMKKSLKEGKFQEQEKKYNELEHKMNNSKYDKKGNKTIERIGVPSMVDFFQAYATVGADPDEWIKLLDFFIAKDEICSIDNRLIEAINYAGIEQKEVYLYVISRFNKMKIKGNLIECKSYHIFLERYLRNLSSLAFINTEELHGIALLCNKKDLKSIQESILTPMKNKLIGLRNDLCEYIQIKDEIDILINFIEKNYCILSNENMIKIEKARVHTSYRSVMRNEEEYNRLKEYYDSKEIESSYQQNKITAYELQQLVKEKSKEKQDDE